MRIPTDEEHPSMNLGQAVAVCLYEIVRTRVPAQLQKLPSADAEQLERITTQLLDALRASGYVKPRATTAAEAKVRRMIRRLNLSAEDAELWLGMLRQILWKLRD
jgi:tRNA/rRNA methyltransferase